VAVEDERRDGGVAGVLVLPLLVAGPACQQRARVDLDNERRAYVGENGQTAKPASAKRSSKPNPCSVPLPTCPAPTSWKTDFAGG
jgi:hypothetical protein